MTADGRTPLQEPPLIERDTLRLAFVEMLFALAVGQVAVQAANVLSEKGDSLARLPGLSHLALALVLIAVSWVGWSRSQSPGMTRDRVNYIFSMPFVGLLMDVLLVILYFIVVQTTEVEQKDGATLPATPTAVPEAYWLMVVFGTYAAWDVLTDVFSENCIPKISSFRVRILKILALIFVSFFSSMFCLLLVYFAWQIAPGCTEGYQVVLVDAALLCVVLFFRAFKAVENFLGPQLRVTDCKAFNKARETQGIELWCGIGLILTYGLCLAAASWPWN